VYQYCPPKPIVVYLKGEDGFALRKIAADFVQENLNTTGAERGNKAEQGFGALAEIVVRSNLGMAEINDQDHPVGYDLMLPTGVKVDVKCRGGSFPFREFYESDDGISREAKHNFFARQIFDENIDADIFLMTHLETPVDKNLPGTKKQRKWALHICGWVSKKRVLREGVYLPRGSLTEQGRTWFTYRAHEIEFYNRNLNGLKNVSDLLTIEAVDVGNDEKHIGELNVTSADALRIVYDLAGRRILTQEHVDIVIAATGLKGTVKPVLHPNQYFHVLKWLKERGQITQEEFNKAENIMAEKQYEGF